MPVRVVGIEAVVGGLLEALPLPCTACDVASANEGGVGRELDALAGVAAGVEAVGGPEAGAWAALLGVTAWPVPRSMCALVVMGLYPPLVVSGVTVAWRRAPAVEVCLLVADGPAGGTLMNLPVPDRTGGRP